MKLLIMSLFSTCLVFGVTPVAAILNMYNASPAAPGTQLTTTILNNGVIGTLGGFSITGTGASLTVGAHNPLCSLPVSASLSGITYTSGFISQAIALNNASSFTYVGTSASGSNPKVTVSGCITFGGNTVTTNIMDQIAVLASGSGGAFLQQSTSGHIEIESVFGSTHHSPNITPGVANPTLWCSFSVDPTTAFPGVGSSGTASLACFLPYPPYAQVGGCTPGTGCSASGTVSVDIQNAAGWGNIGTIRLGNAEVGTASGTTTTFENMLFDYNAVFPLTPTLSVPSTGIISPLRATDWSGAGVIGGIPTRTNICSTLGTSGQAPTFVQSVTASQINSAITACGTGNVVKLNAGTYNIDAITWGDTSSVANGVTLRGAGADQTLIVAQNNMTSPCSANGTFVCMASTDNNFKTSPSNSATWSAGFLSGTNVITLSVVTNLKIGNPIILDQLDAACDTGWVITSDSTTTCSPTSPGISGPYSLEGNGGNFPRSGRNQTEVHIVIGCNGSTTTGTTCTGTSTAVTISPPLRYPNWSSSLTAQAWWATNPIHDVGIEDLSIDCTAITGLCIQVKNGYNTWRAGVRTIQPDRAHTQYVYSVHNTMRNNYEFLTQNGATQSYGYDCNVGGDNLVENNITQAVEGPFKENGCTGDVVDYNYSTNLYYSASAGWAQTNNSDHTAGDAYNLFEGNLGKGHESDVFHGTHHFETDFRNYYYGEPPVCYASGASYATAVYGSCTNNLHSFRIESFSRGFNAVGNVLGIAGAGFSYAGSQPNIYEIGVGNTEGAVTVPDDAITGTTFLRWGNWDSANAATRFQSSEVPSGLTGIQQWFTNALPASQTLPSSFYYSSQPSWWPVTKAWPAIGPDVSGGNIANVGGHAYTIPAQDCYLNTMGGPSDGTGPVLTFNASTCYSQSTSGGSVSTGSQVRTGLLVQH